MIPTVRQVLALPAVAAGRPTVGGGHGGLDRAVRWVHVSDALDMTGLLQGGELVMTTGPAFDRPLHEVRGYLRMLADLRVAAVIIELGTHVQRLPEEVGRLADEVGLPLVALADRIRFLDVTEQVHRMIVADRYEELQFARDTHETFTSMNISRASPKDIVTKASEILTAPVVLEDLNRRVLAFCNGDLPAAVLLDGWGERSRLNVMSESEGSGWLAVPVGVGREQWARLVLAAAPSSRSRSRMVLERAAQSLQLQRMLEQDRDAVLLQALGGLLDDLLAGRVSDDAEAIARAKALGLSGSGRYAPLVIKTVRRGDGDALAQGAADRQMLSAARQAAAAAGLTAIASIRREGTVVMVLSCPHPAAVDAALAAFCAGLQERLATRGNRADWAAGTAASAAGLVAAASGLVEAEHVAEVGLTMTGRKRLFRSADARLRGLFALLRSDHRVQAFARAELGNLLAHDARTGDNLIGVLEAYLEAGGSKSEAAQAIGVSRPTFYARLSIVERILGVSLEDAESRASLHAALMISQHRA